MAPIKSLAQLKKLGSLEAKGEVKKGTVKKWVKETPNMKSLPKKVAKKK